ncbi:MAG: zf-HC2 domain-containing protein [Anaerolineaceae bacterium]|nr:zf-HC2 domain-containing protein [Anaerolineaceae bacterium]
MACEHNTHLITAYIQGELPSIVRLRFARHLNTCETCYAAYRRELDLMQELTQTMPRIGAAQQPDFKRVWTAVEAELSQPTPRQRFAHFQTRYGLAALLFALALIVPLTMGNSEVTWASPPTQPAPHIVTSSRTPTQPVAVGTAVALYTATQGHTVPDVRPQPDETTIP